jgi:LPPG:FO 2-phospho-L-lactate transferase
VTAIVGIGGGIGASRLWRVLTAAVDPASLTLVVNTGDDIWLHGLRICPDLDTTLYALSGRQDAERGWGLRDESFRAMDELRGLGADVWFNLGDRDLATHLLRTGMLRDGQGLCAVTARLADGMGVGVRVLPMTESEVATTIETADGRRLHYEEFLVRERAEPEVRRVAYDGAAACAPAPGVLEAIAAADVIVLAPSNPMASIGPVLAVPGVRAALQAASAPVVAVSPIVSRVPIDAEGDRGRAAARAALLRSAAVEPTASGVAALYAGLCDRYVLDAADEAEAGAVRDLGLEAVAVPTLVHRGAPPQALLDAVLTVRV